MRKLGGWWRLWIALTAIWMVIVGVFATTEFTRQRDSRALQQDAAIKDASMHCRGRVFGRNVDLSADPSARIELLSVGLRLIRPPNPFDQFDDADFENLPRDTWAQVVRKSEFKALSSQEREQAREQYFRQEVATRLGDAETIRSAKTAFDTVYENYTPPETQGKGQDSIFAALQARADGTDDLARQLENDITFVNQCAAVQTQAEKAEALPQASPAFGAAAIAGLAPPLFVLLFGLLVSWVVAGFRRQPNKP